MFVRDALYVATAPATSALTGLSKATVTSKRCPRPYTQAPAVEAYPSLTNWAGQWQARAAAVETFVMFAGVVSTTMSAAYANDPTSPGFLNSKFT